MSSMYNYDKALKYPYIYFKVVGWLQDKNATKLYIIYGRIMHLIGCDILLLLQLLHLVVPSSLFDITELLGVLSIYILLVHKSINFIMRLNEISDLSDNLKVLITIFNKGKTKSLDHLQARLDQVYKISKFYFVVVYSAIFFGGLVPLASYFNSPVPPYKISYRMWVPFDYEANDNGFIAVAVYQFLSSVVFGCASVALDTLVLFYFQAGSGLIEELSVRLSEIKHHNQSDKELEAYIDIHIMIKEFLKQAERIFTPVIFVQAAMSSVIFCTLLFRMSKVSSLTRNNNLRKRKLTKEFISQISPIHETSVFMHLASLMIPMLMQILMLCYYGNEVTVASKILSVKLFESQWMEESQRFKIAMKIFMENNKMPIKIRGAQGVFHVDLTTYLRICNMAYSMYAVLKTIH